MIVVGVVEEIIYICDNMKEVIIDTREQGVIKSTALFFDDNKYTVKIDKLDDGDVLIKNTDKPSVIIERKTISDFASSIKNNHLQNQCIRMREKYKFAYVIVYGKLSSLNYKYQKFSLAQMQGAISSITIRYGCPVFWVNTFEDYLTMMLSIVDKVNNLSEPLTEPLVYKKHPNSRMQILLGVPKIGNKKAINLLDKFKTPKAIFNASDEELLEVPLITKAIIEEIRKVNNYE